MATPLSDCAGLADAAGLTAASAARLAAVAPALEAAAASTGVELALLIGLTRVESNWRASAVSSAGAQGLAQVMPATGAEIAAGIGIPWEPFDPAVNARVAATFLRALSNRWADKADRDAWVLASYYAGAGAVSKNGPYPYAAYVEAVRHATRAASATLARCRGEMAPQPIWARESSTAPRPTPSPGPSPRPQEPVGADLSGLAVALLGLGLAGLAVRGRIRQ